MGLQNIFEMAKADRYTADGREELAKAREADVEDRTYNIGEISQKTGLQKTANGWVKPRAESNTAASKSPEASFKSTKPAGTIEKGKVFVDRFGGSESLKVDEVGSDGSFSYTVTKSDGSKASGKASNEKELRHILATSGYGERKGDSEKENLRKLSNAEHNARIRAGITASGIDTGSRYQNENGAKIEVNNIGDDGSVNYSVRHPDGTRKTHEARSREELERTLSDLGYFASDSAPRALTGDCKVRVRK